MTMASEDAPTSAGRDRSERLERLHHELMDVADLPTAPEIALKVLSMIEGDATSARALSTLIARDQVLTARLLRLANTAFFGKRRSLTNVGEVITLLGFERVRDTVLSLSVWDGFVPLDAHWRCILWTHSTMVAAAAQALAHRVGSDGSQAYTSALLHDVGKLVFGFHVGAPYWRTLQEAPSEEALIAAEEREYGCDHATVGGWLLEVWRLPPTLVAPVVSHHAPLPRMAPHAKLDIPQLVALADRLVCATDGNRSMADRVELVLAGAPGVVTEESWRETYRSIESERETMGHLFGDSQPL
jgi:putative nucleotidyltransferase with HDIG domain